MTTNVFKKDYPRITFLLSGTVDVITGWLLRIPEPDCTSARSPSRVQLLRRRVLSEAEGSSARGVVGEISRETMTELRRLRGVDEGLSALIEIGSVRGMLKAAMMKGIGKEEEIIK